MQSGHISNDTVCFLPLSARKEGVVLCTEIHQGAKYKYLVRAYRPQFLSKRSVNLSTTPDGSLY